MGSLQARVVTKIVTEKKPMNHFETRKIHLYYNM